MRSRENLTAINHESFVTTKSVVSLVSGLYIATGLAVVSSVLFLLTSLDRAAKADRAHRVDIALNLEARYLKTVLLEYSYWDEAYEAIVVEIDETWIEQNSGQYLIDEHGFDFSLAIKAGNQLAHLSLHSEVEGLQFEQLMAGGLEELIATSLQSEVDEGMVAGYITAGRDIYLVALSPFINEETEAVRPGSYLSMGRRLDDDYIEELAAAYELPGLHLAHPTERVTNTKTLTNTTGQAIGRLAWSLQRPSLLIAPKVIAIVMPFVCVAMLLTQYFLKRDHADRTAFEEHLYKEATLDPLTNISNRRHLIALGQQEMAVHRRNGGELAVALFDIDHFKVINDTYGHATGDKALIHLTHICANELRESDLFGRLGGDEFAIILQETPLTEAIEVIDRVRTSIEACPMVIDHYMIPLTISVGLVPMAEQTDFESLLKRADVALYEAKKRGRNQVWVSQGDNN
ncbi:sensor domain-containing diguanylate cyclase [Leptolyngbya iicbica]|uniref:Diguanylate cyclase n=2 Tax=Cyanophyceae TaxID=3028117 RepID=A0A4Q7EAI0_9CYAN|nr:diguanylate cyclase [Leptolyngbya sp. LK]RZM79474.1 diguanylate cyclase [Leptolyngbya sp. LK]